MDRALSALIQETLGDQPELAVVAVGGYGRGELSPHSDIDLLFLLPARSDVTKGTLRSLLYPLWDAGWQVGHATRTTKQAIEQTAGDLDAATAILTARWVAGGHDLYDEFRDRRMRWLKKEGKTLARRIAEATAERHHRVDRAGWVLAPDLREDIGGLRDLHRLLWLGVIADDRDLPEEVKRAGELLLAVREALHAEVKRKSDALRIDLQPKVATRLGLEGDRAADELMFEVHSAARTVEHIGELHAASMSELVTGGPKRSGALRDLDGGIRIEDGALTFHPKTRPEVARALRLLAIRSETGRSIHPRSVKQLKDIFGRAEAAPWSEPIRESFFAILSGPHATAALETLDHVGAWPVLVPEWERVRALAQHDPYHRYTVDGHLFVVVAEIWRALEKDPIARAAAEESGDLEALLLAALLHDIGKGSGRDHSTVGEEIARGVCRRIGLGYDETDDVCALVRWHLLLVDTATRRDLDDGAVISDVADTIADGKRLRMLYILSVADGHATGPDGWSEWKGALVADLYRKALVALETGEVPARSDVTMRAREVESYEPGLAGRAEDVLATLPPSYLQSTSVPDMVDDIRLLLQPPDKGQIRYRVYERTESGEAAVTVCVRDRPGTLARTAGVFALNRISVLRAHAFSTSAGLALERFVVRLPDERGWEGFLEDLEASYSGRLALEARLERKIHDYRPPQPIDPEVRILTEESSHSTVIEVRAPDTLGLLFALTAALTDLDLDIHVAKIDTLGHRVVDVFYVRNAWGEKLTEEQCSEVERSIRHRVRRLFP